MRRADEIDVMAATGLQGQHHISQVVWGYQLAMTQMTNVVILTKKAPQVAMGKKNGSRATTSHQGRFFPEMRAEAGYHRLSAGLAKTSFTGQSIHLASAWA